MMFYLSILLSGGPALNLVVVWEGGGGNYVSTIMGPDGHCIMNAVGAL